VNREREKRESLLRRAREIDLQALWRPGEAIEVDRDLAAHMGAFIEDAVSAEDTFWIGEALLAGQSPHSDGEGTALAPGAVGLGEGGQAILPGQSRRHEGEEG
jgi:hypothetical protein